MRKKIIIELRWNEYIVWELTVEQYLKLVNEETNEVLQYDILKEFNEEIPKLKKEQAQKLVNTLFNIVKEENLKDIIKQKTKEPSIPIEDFHILVWVAMKQLNQPYSEIMKMPIRYFNMLMQDLEIIVWQKEYNKKRNSKRIDSKSLQKEFGEIKWNKKVKA